MCLLDMQTPKEIVRHEQNAAHGILLHIPWGAVRAPQRRMRASQDAASVRSY
jgi:hypothetical protein